MCPANENHQTLVATEGATFGTIYWMMNENYKIDPFKIAPTIPGTGTFLTILSSLDVFKSRKVIASKFTLFENVTPKDLIDHRCEDCENNVRPTDAWLESDKGKPTLRNQMHPDYHPTYKKNSEYEDAQEDFDDIELKVFQKLCNMEDNLFKQIIDFEKPKEQFTAPPHPQMTHRVAQPHYVPVEYFNHTISDLLRQISGLQHEQAMQNGQMQHMANEIRSIGNAVCSLHSSQLQQPPNSAASMFPYPIHPMPSTFPQQAPHAPNAPQMTANSMQSIAELILAQRGIAPRRERRLTEGPKKYNRVIPPSPRIPSSTDKKEMLKKSNDRFDKLREEVSDVRTQLSGLEDTTFKKPKKLHFLEPDEESESDENGNDVDEFSEADDDDEDVDREMKVLVESLKNRVQ
ncbi:Reverse transcriptase domain-containing protein [Caenorhabditis elegans]|nr:Reverse transcriptase domain-containing protein [Caenorhabditis elegans]CCD66808.1 Reverse transcriptase domain-containing protein [Caenorhabditis elegans]|eukprot:NP_492834.1 Uncharacterized protein CELE_C35E7.2 [Caenorhabditis elegans]